MSSARVGIRNDGSSPRLLPATAVWGGHRGGAHDKPAHDGKHEVSTSTHQPPTKVTPVPSRPAPGDSSTSAAPTPFDLVHPGENRSHAKTPRSSPCKREDIMSALRTIKSIMVAQKMEGQAAVKIQAWLRGVLTRRTLRTRLSPTSNSGVRFMGGSVPSQPSHEPSDGATGIDKIVDSSFDIYSKKTRRRQRRRGRPPRTGGAPYYSSSSRLLTYPGPSHISVPTAFGSKKLNVSTAPSPKRRRRRRRYRSRYRNACSDASTSSSLRTSSTMSTCRRHRRFQLPFQDGRSTKAARARFFD